MLQGLKNISDSEIVRTIASGRIALAFKIAWLLLAFMSFNSFTAGGQPLHYAAYYVAAFGFVVLTARLIAAPHFMKTPFLLLLALFLVSFVVSAVLARKYGVTENIKGFVWITLEFVCLYATDDRSTRDDLLSELRVLAWVVVVVSFLSAALGLGVGFAGYEDASRCTSTSSNYVGMANGRLFGIYSDPNYGSVYGIISVLLSVWIYLGGKEPRARGLLVFCIANALVQLMYIGLSGSRTGVFGSMFVGAVVCFVVIWRLLLDKWHDVIRFALSLMLSACVALCLFGSFKLAECAYNASEIIASSIEIVSQSQIEGASANQGDAACVKPPSDVGLSARNSITGGGEYSAGRIAIWQSAWEIFCGAPIFGTSHRYILEYSQDNNPDTFISMRGYSTMHNVFMDVLVGQGITGVLVFFVFAICAVIRLVKSCANTHNLEFARCLLLFGTVLAIAFSAMFYSEILYINTVGSVVFWVMLGVMMRLNPKDSNEKHIDGASLERLRG